MKNVSVLLLGLLAGCASDADTRRAGVAMMNFGTALQGPPSTLSTRSDDQYLPLQDIRSSDVRCWSLQHRGGYTQTICR